MVTETRPLEAVVLVDRTAVTPETVPEIAATAAALTDVEHPHHVARYPAMARQLHDRGVEATSAQTVARDIVTRAGQELIPSAVDRELRLAVMREIDWQASPEPIAAAAAADKDAFYQLGARLLGMAAWQDVDLATVGDPVAAFGPAEQRHRELCGALGWTAPERVLPEARQALERDRTYRDAALGPVDGLVVWEVEELIEMGLSFVQALGADLPTVGIYVRNASLRRPYAETHSLLSALAASGVGVAEYDDLSVTATAATAAPVESDRDRSTVEMPPHAAAEAPTSGGERQ